MTSAELLLASSGEGSAVVRARVLVARERQLARGALNAQLPQSALRERCLFDAGGLRLLAEAVDRGGMSAPAVHRAVRVARTIADLAVDNQVTAMHLAEALQYRRYESRRRIP